MKGSPNKWLGFVVVFILVVWLVSSSGAQRRAAEMADPQDYVPGELLVKFVPGAPASAAEHARQAVGARVLKTFRQIGVEHWRLGRGVSVEHALDILSRMAERRHIEYAEPNFIVQADSIYPNDPLRSELWSLHNLGQTGGTKDADIDAPEAWGLQQGSSTVVVGVVDSGVDYTHPDLAANIWTNPGEIPGNGIDDDGNGYIDDVRGWDFFNNDNDPMDDHGHGTHTSGTIGAVGDNGIGVAGVNWRVKIMPLKFLGAGGSGPISAAISAILYAGSFGVPITNHSWGGPKSRAFQDAAASLLELELLVASAGNSGSSSKQYPAGYDLDNIISVAATDHNDLLASFSNYGSTWVDLGAPGVNIYSLAPNNSYRFMSGTSMAAPHVTGVAALVLAQFPGETPLGIKSRILLAVDKVPSLAGKTVTGGRLNAARAIGVEPTPSGDTTPPSAIADLSAGAATSESVVLSWTATGNDGMAGSAYLYDVRYSTAPISETNWAGATPALLEPVPQTAGAPENFTLQDLSGGTTYYIAIKAADADGNFSAISNVAVGTTQQGLWTVEVVDTAADGFYNSVAFGLDGSPAVAYSGPNNAVKFARKAGAAWQVEIVATTSNSGISLAFDPGDGNPSISYGWGKLMFAHRSGTSWQIQTIESSVANNDYTSLVYDSARRPAISYRLTGRRAALKLARWTGSAWILEIVDAGAGARYSSLAFDPNGNPSIAYSDDMNDDNILDTVKFAHWNGSVWVAEVVETGTDGYGVFAALAYDPTVPEGRPCIAHLDRYLCKNSTVWETAQVVDGFRGGALLFNSSGEALMAYSPDAGGVAFSRRTSSGWQIETVQKKVDVSWLTRMALDPYGRPAVSYGDYTNKKMLFAQRQTP